MITIAIVEDEEAYAKQLTEYIEKYQRESGKSIRVIRFSDGDEIVEKYTGEYDIILMDIQMKFMDGMSAAEAIRKQDTKVVIMFITNMIQYAVRGYEVDAMDGSKELCKAATKYTGIQVHHMLFEDFNDSNIYDGIWACASILHLKKCELSDMIKRLYQALKRNGVIYMSFKYGDFEGVRNGRYFTYLTEESFDMLMEPINGFKKEKIWATGDVRENRGTEQWLNIILRKVTII